MKCAECGETATARVTVNGAASVVCETHRLAIVRRIEEVTARLGRSTPNMREILLMALDHIAFEDLP